jgi:hypothetical protein
VGARNASDPPSENKTKNELSAITLLSFLNHLMTLGLKLQLLHEKKKFSVYITLKCTNDCTMHRGRQNVKEKMSVKCTESSTERLKEIARMRCQNALCVCEPTVTS